MDIEEGGEAAAAQRRGVKSSPQPHSFMTSLPNSTWRQKTLPVFGFRIGLGWRCRRALSSPGPWTALSVPPPKPLSGLLSYLLPLFCRHRNYTGSNVLKWSVIWRNRYLFCDGCGFCLDCSRTWQTVQIKCSLESAKCISIHIYCSIKKISITFTINCITILNTLL